MTRLVAREDEHGLLHQLAAQRAAQRLRHGLGGAQGVERHHLVVYRYKKVEGEVNERLAGGVVQWVDNTTQSMGWQDNATQPKTTQTQLPIWSNPLSKSLTCAPPLSRMRWRALALVATTPYPPDAVCTTCQVIA